MPTITIDGKKIECDASKSIIEAALENDIEIPHFCWHPALSVSGNCRMCFVEIEGARKLATACTTLVGDNQVVYTASEKAVKGREAIMEFLLINHPLDCPICDEAGQCKLQDLAFLHGRRESRFEEMKNRKEKRVPLGPQVLFDAERCISCSRCIRYADEIAEQPVLTFVNRGDHVTIETFPGTEFDSPYSMNVIDICPVGALTSQDFRFKARVWDMSFNGSVCPGCARGCNTHVGVRNNEILRLEPRTNMRVNEYWMCDPGRLETYEWVNEGRLHHPTIRRSNQHIEVSWEEAYSEVAAKLRGLKGTDVAFIGSSRMTSEENYALAKFASEVVGGGRPVFYRHLDPSFGDDKLRVSDRAPNSRGAQELGFQSVESLDELVAAIEQGRVKGLYVLDQDLPVDDRLEEALEKLDVLIVHAWNATPIAQAADIVLSNSTWAEVEGTYVDVKGTVQHIEPAVVTAENERRMGMKMSRLDKFGSYNDRWTHGDRRASRPAWIILKALARLMGRDWNWRWTEDVFVEMAGRIEGFRDMDYTKLDENHGIDLGMGNRPRPHGIDYVPHHYRPQIMRVGEEG